MGALRPCQQLDLSIISKSVQDELREKILKLALQDTKKKLSHSTARSLRLVQKSWLKSTTKLFQKAQEPLFKLILTKNNSVSGTPYVTKNGKLLDQFVSAVSTSYGNLDDICPTFSLKIPESFFRLENHESLSKALSTCGEGLSQLEMVIPVNGGSLKCIFPAFYMPSLKILTLRLSKVELVDPSGGPQHHKDNVTYLLHSFLGGAPNLEELVVRYPDQEAGGDFFGAVAFHYLTLPPRLTRLTLECELTAGDLEMLAKCSLPYLTSLALQVPDTRSYPEETLFRILNNFRGTLQKFCIFKRRKYLGPPRNVTRFRFPVIPNLWRFTSFSWNLELEEEGGGDWPYLHSKLVPKLSYLKLTNQTPAMLSKWTGAGVSLGSVKHLTLSFVDQGAGHEDQNDLSTSMEGVARTFCNLHKLTVTVRGRETTGLQTIFKKMGGKLQELRIIVVNAGTPSSDYWDTLLIGVPVKLLAVLKKAKEFWGRFELRSDEKTPSIRNMKELRTLTLEADVDKNSCGRRGAPKPFISDIAFQFALLKMAKLRSLRFKGRFKASSEMAEEWRRHGLSYVHTASN